MMNLRSATPDDAATMAAVHIDAWRTAYRGLVPDSFLAGLDHGRRTEGFRAFLASGEGETYIAERDGQPIGHLTVGPCRDDDLHERSVGEIWGIYLAPVHWRQGIGTRVCRRAEEMLTAHGVGRIVLWVFEGNDRARRFYEAMGYTPDGATKIIEVGVPLPAVRYSKELNSAAVPPEDVVDQEAEAQKRSESCSPAAIFMENLRWIPPSSLGGEKLGFATGVSAFRLDPVASHLACDVLDRAPQRRRQAPTLRRDGCLRERRRGAAVTCHENAEGVLAREDAKLLRANVRRQAPTLREDG